MQRANKSDGMGSGFIITDEKKTQTLSVMINAQTQRSPEERALS